MKLQQTLFASWKIAPRLPTSFTNSVDDGVVPSGNAVGKVRSKAFPSGITEAVPQPPATKRQRLEEGKDGDPKSASVCSENKERTPQESTAPPLRKKTHE